MKYASDLAWLTHRVVGAFRRRAGLHQKISYSQCGEDLIVRYVFDSLKVAAPSYLDIGAHHPGYLNNTRIFYDAGSRGVNVEPDPTLIDAFRRQRPRDTNLNVGVAAQAGELPFHVMNVKTLNTFSRVDAEAAVREGNGRIQVERTVNVPVVDVNDLLEKHFEWGPDFLSLDVEGLDLLILQAIDYARSRPRVICVETVTFSENRQGRKIEEIPGFLEGAGYFRYADTWVNSIFVDKSVW
jgi:FkbM family methyltransferase